MKILLILFLNLAINLNLLSQNAKDDSLLSKAEKLAHENIIVDTHIDLPLQIYYNNVDPSEKSKNDFDYYRAKKGGLDVPFMSIYVPARYQGTEDAQIIADSVITLVEQLAEMHPDKFALAYSTDDVYENFEKGLISLPMGMENGAPATDFELLEHYYDRGIRYITLTHSKDNHIGDSSYDDRNTNNGLSKFGKKLVKEMNKLGIMIDVSHVTDKTFYDVIEITGVPVIASHSSCRHFTPGFERNMSDDLIKKLAETGGVIQINFGSDFLSGEYQKQGDKFREHRAAFIKDNNLKSNDPKVQKFTDNYWKEHPKVYADVSDVVDHIDHVVKLVGIDHVGIGSDFDGVGDSLPTGLKDVSMFPNLIYEMLKRGYTEEEIKKVLNGNIMRVWKEIEAFAEIN